MTLTQAEPGEDVLGTVHLAGGRTLTVRPVTAADADGLEALFAGLGEDDRYYRFFSLSHPGRAFAERLTRAAQEGGWRLVAVVSGPGGGLVAEAGYVLLPDGNGEFALTIAAGWRGWLGPYLLDALTAAAAARGVPNLQADILLGNSRMLALVSQRGYVTLSRDGAELRVAIAAAAAPRSLPGRHGSALLPHTRGGAAATRVAVKITAFADAARAASRLPGLVRELGEGDW